MRAPFSIEKEATHRRWNRPAAAVLVGALALPAGGAGAAWADVVEQPTAESQGTWMVERGDSFWSIARRTMDERGGDVPLAEVATYWRRLVDANEGNLVRAGNPHHILPGQQLVLPALEVGRATTTQVWFSEAGRLVPVQQVVTLPDVGADALRALLEGPDQAGLTSEVPAGTELLGLDIDDDVATVDLSSAFATGGGSASMRARVAQVVYTITEFSTVSEVRFLIDGEPVEALGGEGLLLDEPVGRDRFSDLTGS